MNENKSEKHLLGELLAVLNGDGGQYAVEHGVEAAFKRGLERHYAHVPHEPPGRTEYVVGLEREVERLRGIQPELPPRPPEGGGLPRYGLRWNGLEQPVAVPMDDGYWTPFHLAAAAAAVAADDLRSLRFRVNNLRADLAAEQQNFDEAITAQDQALTSRHNNSVDWYQQRFNALRTWVHQEVKPLSEEAAHRYFAIVANGSPAPHEQADWRNTMHGLTLRAEKAERERDACAASRQSILEMYEEAVKERDLARAQATVPKPRTSGTGMCPYCGQPAGSSGCQRSHP
jgi:hypothetical protein